MDVVGCHHVAEYGETEAFLRFENQRMYRRWSRIPISLEIHALSSSSTKYWDSDSEAASLTIPEEEKVPTEIFGR
jgi:hypothetical protein